METSRPYQTMIPIVVSVNSSEKCIPEKLTFCTYFLLSSLKIFWRISRTIMTPVNKEFNYLHLSTEKDFLQRVVFLFWEILRLKVESRILRLMLKTFPISQICDGDSPSSSLYFLFSVLILLLTISCLYFHILAQTFCKKPHLACVGCKSCNISFHQHWSQVTYL